MQIFSFSNSPFPNRPKQPKEEPQPMPPSEALSAPSLGARWQEIGLYLLKIENAFQKQTLDNPSGAPNFTSWLKKQQTSLGIKPTMLWQILSSTKYWQTHLQDKYAALISAYVPAHDILRLPKSVGPEKLQLLSRLERHVEPALFEDTLKKTLQGELSQFKLRDMWKAYAPLANPNAIRGRGRAQLNLAELRDPGLMRFSRTSHRARTEDEKRETLIGKYLIAFDSVKSQFRAHAKSSGNPFELLFSRTVLRPDLKDQNLSGLHGLMLTQVKTKRDDFRDMHAHPVREIYLHGIAVMVDTPEDTWPSVINDLIQFASKRVHHVWLVFPADATIPNGLPENTLRHSTIQLNLDQVNAFSTFQKRVDQLCVHLSPSSESRPLSHLSEEMNPAIRFLLAEGYSFQ